VTEYGSKVKEEEVIKEKDAEASSSSSPSSSSSLTASTPVSPTIAKKVEERKEDKLIGKEESQQGSVSMDVYKQYAMSTGMGGVVFVIILFICTQG
jgi:hypothetical protein